jgi:hypothetical protein
VAVFITVILFNSIRAAYAYQRFRRTPPSTAPAQPAV